MQQGVRCADWAEGEGYKAAQRLSLHAISGMGLTGLHKGARRPAYRPLHVSRLQLESLQRQAGVYKVPCAPPSLSVGHLAPHPAPSPVLRLRSLQVGVLYVPGSPKKV